MSPLLGFRSPRCQQLGRGFVFTHGPPNVLRHFVRTKTFLVFRDTFQQHVAFRLLMIGFVYMCVYLILLFYECVRLFASCVCLTERTGVGTVRLPDVSGATTASAEGRSLSATILRRRYRHGEVRRETEA